MIQLDKEILDSTNEHDIQRILYAILGHVLDGKVLVSLLASVTRRDELSVRTQGLLTSALADVALYNFPGIAREYLSTLIKKDDLPTPGRTIVEKALERSETYFSELRERPYLKELKPPERRLHRFQVVEKQLRRRFFETVHNESALLSLVRNVPLKYGRAWFSERDGEILPPAKLGHFESKYEMPRSQVIDPLGMMMKREQWRALALKEYPMGSQEKDDCDNTTRTDEERLDDE